MKRLGMPVSDTTILAGLRSVWGLGPNRLLSLLCPCGWRRRLGVAEGPQVRHDHHGSGAPCGGGRAGGSFGATMTNWFRDHPNVDVISRDRAGLYAEAAREGAPQAKQVADRFI